MIFTCSASTDRDFTTTSKVRAELFGATATSTAQDARIADMIRAASRWAETYMGYECASVQSYQEMVAGAGRRRLMLGTYPVRAVRRMYDSTDTGTATQILSSEFRLEAQAGFVNRDAGFSWTPTFIGREAESAVPFAFTPAAGQEYEPWLLDFVAGWTYDGIDTGSDNWSTEKGTTSTGRTLPEDVERAVVLRAATLFEGTENLIAEELDGLKVTYRSNRVDDDTPSPSQLLLQPYRRYK